MRNLSIAAGLVLTLGLAGPAAAQDDSNRADLSYKDGESWPGRNFNGVDFLEPFFPVASVRAGDGGRILLDSALPYALLISSFAAYHEDRDTAASIGKWRGLSLDAHQDNYPLLLGFIALTAASILLPAPDDDLHYQWDLRLDRATVLALGMGLSSLEREALVPVFRRRRPDGNGYDARPSGHAATAFAAATFLSNVLRDTLRPQFEENLALRVVEEFASTLPYIPAGYVGLERIHHRRHYLTDTFLGAAIGSFTMNFFYSWSMAKRESGYGWVQSFYAGYDPGSRGVELAVLGSF